MQNINYEDMPEKFEVWNTLRESETNRRKSRMDKTCIR